MPVYTYRRQDGTTFEHRQKFTDDPLEICPTTGQPVTRVVQVPGIIFKGSGFYVTDSKKATNGNSNASKSDKAESKAETESKPDKTEKKTEVKTESAAD